MNPILHLGKAKEKAFIVYINKSGGMWCTEKEGKHYGGHIIKDLHTDEEMKEHYDLLTQTAFKEIYGEKGKDKYLEYNKTI